MREDPQELRRIASVTPSSPRRPQPLPPRAAARRPYAGAVVSSRDLPGLHRHPSPRSGGGFRRTGCRNGPGSRVDELRSARASGDSRSDPGSSTDGATGPRGGSGGRFGARDRLGAHHGILRRGSAHRVRVPPATGTRDPRLPGSVDPCPPRREPALVAPPTISPGNRRARCGHPAGSASTPSSCGGRCVPPVADSAERPVPRRPLNPRLSPARPPALRADRRAGEARASRPRASRDRASRPRGRRGPPRRGARPSPRDPSGGRGTRWARRRG